MSPEHRRGIEAELLEWMAERPLRFEEDRFEGLARRLFACQYAACLPYRRLCDARGVTPESLRDWREIPAVPTGAFKELRLSGFDESETIKTFRTSGTSGGPRGELHLDTLALYEASLMASLDTYLLPDLATGARLRIRVLAPSGAAAPDSSLSHMFEVLLRIRGDQASGFAMASSSRGAMLDLDALITDLEHACSGDSPIALCGTAFAFVHLCDALEEHGLRYPLPRGSRIMETGGFKGRSREVAPQDLYAMLTHLLGIPDSHIVNQYGMSELGSQFYDSVIVDPAGPRRKLGPPWARVRFIDPETGLDAAPGEVGMIVVHDLANTGSVAAIQTADLGRGIAGGEADSAGGFEILGRSPGAEARGCSIAADLMLSAPGGAPP